MRNQSFIAALTVGSLGIATLAHADSFDCYENCTVDLKTDPNCLQGVSYDYDFSTVDRGSDVTVMSFHGGNIELHTSTIARTVADQNSWNWYNFAGHGRSSCLNGLSNFGRLHITAINFNEPTLHDLVGRYPNAVAIHGFSEDTYPRGTICVGGRNAAQVQAFIDSINANKSRFTRYSINAVNAATAPSGTTCSQWRGTAQDNPVNRSSSGAGGLQLELNLDIRKDLVNVSSDYNALRDVFYGAIHAAMTTT
ncbi:poly-gamma-glutamate hydrolase family protein [Archangium lipolyticum]|uniref:poly-gamma-glutamate hydrolase family protein n=1 Tax=Archangium lipolyticum TaxID=2970465 RepID=UPI002149A85C|nr:poly-gamma-glutamate hydrolase family protein [Archangium lipolyticum]